MLAWSVFFSYFCKVDLVESEDETSAITIVPNFLTGAWLQILWCGWRSENFVWESSVQISLIIILLSNSYLACWHEFWVYDLGKVSYIMPLGRQVINCFDFFNSTIAICKIFRVYRWRVDHIILNWVGLIKFNINRLKLILSLFTFS